MAAVYEDAGRARGRGGAGHRRATQPIGLARGGAGRGVGALAAAPWRLRPFGPGSGSSAEPAASTLRLYALPLRSAPSAPPAAPP